MTDQPADGRTADGPTGRRIVSWAALSADQLDPVDSLTPVEMRVVNAKLKGDGMKAITEGTAERWDAFARICWVLAKRRDPRAQLATYEGMTITQLGALLPDDTDDDLVDTDDLVDDRPRTVTELEGEAADDPLAR